MLRDYFPNTPDGADIYGGFLYDETIFCKTFPCEDSLNKMLIPVNEFLEKNYNICDILKTYDSIKIEFLEFYAIMPKVLVQ